LYITICAFIITSNSRLTFSAEELFTRFQFWLQGVTLLGWSRPVPRTQASSCCRSSRRQHPLGHLMMRVKCGSFQVRVSILRKAQEQQLEVLESDTDLNTFPFQQRGKRGSHTYCIDLLRTGWSYKISLINSLIILQINVNWGVVLF
jgi:hypothetical protein